MKDVHVVSFSGGKDSTAMLLRMLELKMPVDDIVFCDTGAEFPAMYEHIRKVEKYIHRPITWLKWEHSYEWYLLEKPCKRKISEFWNNKMRKENIDRQDVLGYSFAGPKSRWCTRLKVDAINNHEKKYNDWNIIKYIGIAADEPNRIKDKKYPLVEWGWNETDCLQYCKEKGFDWDGLYDIFKRVSCWCCPLQSLTELRKLRHNFPELWLTLLDWQHKSWRKFRADYSVDELEARFAAEDDYEKMQVKLF